MTSINGSKENLEMQNILYKRLESEADTYFTRISHGIESSEDMVRDSLHFIRDSMSDNDIDNKLKELSSLKYDINETEDFFWKFEAVCRSIINASGNDLAGKRIVLQTYLLLSRTCHKYKDLLKLIARHNAFQLASPPMAISDERAQGTTAMLAQMF